MKLLLLILALGLCSALPQLGGFERIDAYQVQSSTEIQQFINVGLQSIVQEGSSKGEISSSDFQLGKINNIYKQVLNGENYKFDCEFQNSQNQVIRAYFEVSYQRSTSITQLTTYSYEIKTVNVIQSVQDSYVQVDALEVQYSSEIQNILNFGVNQTVAKSIAEKKISGSGYQISAVNVVSKQIVESALFYKCDVDVKSKEGTTVQAVFTVYYQPFLSVTSLIDYVCSVKSTVSQGTATNTTSTTTTTPITPPTTTTNANTASSTQTGAIQPNSTLDAKTNEMLQYGINEILQKGFTSGRIPKDNYNLVQITTASKTSQLGRDNYQFVCSLQNAKGTTVQMTFTISYQASTNSKLMTSFSYSVQNIPITTSTTTQANAPGANQAVAISQDMLNNDTTVQNVQQYGINEILQKGFNSGRIPKSDYSLMQVISATKLSQNGVDVYQFQCSLQNAKGVSVQMSFTVSYQVSTNKTVVTAYSYNVQNIALTTTAQVIAPIDSQYIAISQDVLQNDSTVQNMLWYGVDQIVQIGSSQGKFPFLKYNITQVSQAYSQVVANLVYYKFKCTLEAMQNGQNIVIEASFTVSYQAATNQKQVVAYSFSVRRAGQVTSSQTSTANTTNVQSVDGTFTACTQDEINTDIVIQDVLTYGSQEIYVRGVQEQKISGANYTVQSVNSVSKQSVTDKGTLYKCDITLSNAAGSTITTTFTILYQVSTGQKSISSYAYQVSTKAVVTNTVEQGNYSAVKITKAQTDTVIQSNINYGIDQVLQKAVEAGKIKTTDFDITNLTSVSQKTQGSSKFFKCEVELSNTEGSIMTMTFTVEYQSSTKKQTLRAYSMNVKTVSQAVQAIQAAYVVVNQTEANHSSEVQTCLNFGINQIVQNNTIYTTKNVKSVQRQVIQGALYYKFEVELSSSTQTISTFFTVFYKADTGEINVSDYSYSIKTTTTTTTSSTSSSSSHSSSSSSSSSSSNSFKYNKAEVSTIKKTSKYQNALNYGVQQCLQNLYDKTFIATTDFQVTETSSFLQQVSSKAEKYKFRTRLTNVAGISLIVNLEVQYQASSNSFSLVSYAVEGSTSTNQRQALLAEYNVYSNYQLLMGSYEKLTQTEVDSNSDVKSCVDYGVQETVKAITKKEKFSANDFKVKEVKSVCRDSVNKDTYRVESTLVNSKGNTIDCNFLVKNQASSSSSSSSSSSVSTSTSASASSFSSKQLTSYGYTTY